MCSDFAESLPVCFGVRTSQSSHTLSQLYCVDLLATPCASVFPGILYLWSTQQEIPCSDSRPLSLPHTPSTLTLKSLFIKCIDLYAFIIVRICLHIDKNNSYHQDSLYFLSFMQKIDVNNNNFFWTACSTVSKHFSVSRWSRLWKYFRCKHREKSLQLIPGKSVWDSLNFFLELPANVRKASRKKREFARWNERRKGKSFCLVYVCRVCIELCYCTIQYFAFFFSHTFT